MTVPGRDVCDEPDWLADDPEFNRLVAKALNRGNTKNARSGPLFGTNFEYIGMLDLCTGQQWCLRRFHQRLEPAQLVRMPPSWNPKRKRR